MEGKEEGQTSVDEASAGSATNSKVNQNFYFDEIVYFKEENCIVSNCVNHSPEKCRRSKFLLFSVRPEWQEIIASQTYEVVNRDEDVYVCGQHFNFAEPTEKNLAPSLFGDETLKENAGVPYKAQKWCCVKDCYNGCQKYSGTTTSTRRPAVYHPLSRVADDAVGRSLLQNLMPKADSIEDHTAYLCHLHLKVLHIDDEMPDATKFKYNRGKDVRYTTSKYNIKLECNLDTTDKSCCIIPNCVFADKKAVFMMGDKHWRPKMFPFPSLFHQPVPRMIWLRLVREAMPEGQKKFCPSVTSKICGLHFPDGKPTKSNPDPTNLEKSDSQPTTSPDGQTIILPPSEDASSVKSEATNQPCNLSFLKTSTASDALKKAVQLKGLVEGTLSSMFHSSTVNPSVAIEEIDIESDDELDDRLRQCQQLMDEDSEDDSGEETDDASEKESDDDIRDDSDNSNSSISPQDSLQTMGRKLKIFLRSKEWRKAKSTLENITDRFDESFIGDDGTKKVVISIDREGTEKNCTKEAEKRALEYVEHHFLEEQDVSQLDIMLKQFNILKDMPPVESSDDSDAGSGSEDEGSDTKDDSPLLSLSRKFKYHLRSLEWMKANKTLNRVTLLFFEAVIMVDSNCSKHGNTSEKPVSRRQSFKTAELNAVEYLRKRMDSDNEQRLLNEMLKQFGRHSAVSKSLMASANVINVPVKKHVPHQTTLQPKLPTSEIQPKSLVAPITGPAFQSLQLMAEVKTMESELILAASKVEAKKVSDILKQIGMRLIAVDKKISIQQVEEEYEEMSPMELKQKALQYLKEHGILCQVKEKRNPTTSTTASKHHTRQTTVLNDTIKAIETPEENTNTVIYQKVASSGNNLAGSNSAALAATNIEGLANPGDKRKQYANELLVDKNAMQTLYVHFNIEPPKKRRKRKTSINGNKIHMTKSEMQNASINVETTAQQFNQPILKEKEMPNDKETVACLKSGYQQSHINELQDKEIPKEQNLLDLKDDMSNENKSQEAIGMNTDVNELKLENSTADESMENHLEGNLGLDEHCQTIRINTNNVTEGESTDSKMILPDDSKEESNKQNLVKLQDCKLSEIGNQNEQSNSEITDCTKAISASGDENNKLETILDAKTGVFTKQVNINKDKRITSVPDNDDNKKLETILDAETGVRVKGSSESSADTLQSSIKEIDMAGVISDDLQYIVTFNASNFKRWKLIGDSESEVNGESNIETNPSFSMLSSVIKGAIDNDLPSLVYQPKSNGKQLKFVDQKDICIQGSLKAVVNVDQPQLAENSSSDLFEGMAASYPGYTSSIAPKVRRVPVFAFYDEYRPWLLFPFGRALRKLLLCTPVRTNKEKKKPTESDNYQVMIDLTDEEVEKAVHKLAKVLAKWEKVKDVNTYSDGIKIVVNDLLQTSESGTFWNMFVDKFMEAVDKELPSIVAQCEEDIKKENETKDKKLEVGVVVKDSGSNPPPPPLKHGPSMQPKGNVATVVSMPGLSHSSTKQSKIAMPALKPGIPNRVQQGQAVAFSMPPRLIGPFTASRQIVSKSTTGQQVQIQQPSNLVSVKLANSNIILLPTSQSKTQFVVGNSPIRPVNAQQVTKSQVLQISRPSAAIQTSSTSGGTPVILSQPQGINTEVTQNQVKSVSVGQSVGHLMVPVTMSGLQTGYVMFVPHTVSLNTTPQTKVLTASSFTPTPTVSQKYQTVDGVNKSNKCQPIASTIPLVFNAQEVNANDEAKQGYDKMREIVTDDILTNTKSNHSYPTSSNPGSSTLLDKNRDSAINNSTGNLDEDKEINKKSVGNDFQIDEGNKEYHENDEMEVVYQPEKLSSICQRVLKKINEEKNKSEESLQDEEPDEGSGSSSDSNSPSDEPSNNDGNQGHEKSSEKKPNVESFEQDKLSNEGTANLSLTQLKLDSTPTCTSSNISLIVQLHGTPSLIGNATPSSTCDSSVPQFKDQIIFVDRPLPGQAVPLPHIVMQTATFPKPLLMTTTESGQRDISAISSTTSSQLFKKSQNLHVPYLSTNKKHQTSSTISSSSNISMFSNCMDDIKSSDFKPNTTIPRDGSLHLEYHKFWNSQFHRFEDLAVQRYEEECKLHFKRHQLSSITKQIHNQIYGNGFNRKNNELQKHDCTRSETSVEVIRSIQSFDHPQSSNQVNFSNVEIKVGSPLEGQSNEELVVEKKHLENKSNSTWYVKTEEMPIKDKKVDNEEKLPCTSRKEISIESAIIRTATDRIHSKSATSTPEENLSDNCDCKKINDDVKATPDKVSTSVSSVITETVTDGSKKSTRFTCEKPHHSLEEVDNINNDLHNNVHPTNSGMNDAALCTTKKYLLTVDDNGCTCNKVQMYVCGSCLEVFSSLEDLREHAVIHLSTEKVLPMFSCERCQVTFTSKRAYDCHQEAHEEFKWNRCSWCGMMFNLVENLEYHLLVHFDINSEQIYECRCRRLFIGLKTIKMHMEDHFPEKGHQCDYCTAKFHFVKNMRKHTEDVHQKSSDRWLNVYWRCHRCPTKYSATSINRLNTHMEDHNDETEFICENCPKTFQYFVDYLIHCMNSCEGRIDSFYDCPICDGRCGKDIATHIKQHLSGMKKCHLCLRFCATALGLKGHLIEKHRLKLNTPGNALTSKNRDKGATNSIKKPKVIVVCQDANTSYTRPSATEYKQGQWCCLCGAKLSSNNLEVHPFCSLCAEDCIDCPFNCGAKLANQRHLTSHFMACHMDRQKHTTYLIVCPHCHKSCRNAGTMALHWIKHCPKNKEGSEMNNNNVNCSVRIDMFETVPDKHALKILKKHRKKKRKCVEHDDETYPKVKKKKKHKRSKKRVRHKLSVKPYVKQELLNKHQDQYSGLAPQPKLIPGHDKLEITCVRDGKGAVISANYSMNAEPTKRIRKKRIYEDMVEIPRSAFLPKVSSSKVGVEQPGIKYMTESNAKKPRRTSRISKPKEFPDYEEDIDKVLRVNRAIKKKKVSTSEVHRTNALKSEKETIKSVKLSKTSCPVIDEESQSDIEDYENNQESSPVKERVRPSNLRPKVNSGHKWDLFHVETILSTIDKLKMRLGRKNRTKGSVVKKKILKNGKFLQKKILQMKEGKCSRKRKVKTLTIQQIVALDHCYLGLPKFMSKKKKGPIYAAPIDHDYVIGPRLDPSVEAEMELAKIRNEGSKREVKESKELTTERLNITSKVNNKKSPEMEDQLSASAQISQIAASLQKKESSFTSEDCVTDETDFDDVVKALLDIGCSTTSDSEIDRDEKDLHNVSSESNLDNDLVDFLADMVFMEENENNEGKVDGNLMNVDLSINDSAILEGLSDLDGNTSGSQEQIDWIPIGNIQEGLGVNSISNEDEALFQISNTIDILSQVPCREDIKNQISLQNMPDIQEEAFLSKLLPQDVEQVLDIIADKMVQNNCEVEVEEEQTHMDLNTEKDAELFEDHSSDDQTKVSDSESTQTYKIDHEHNCDVENQESSTLNVERSVDSNCSEMSITISTNAETSEPNIESFDSNCSEMSINVSTNAETSEPNIESFDSNCSEISINVSTNAEASEPNIESVDSNCSEMSINVSTNAEASEPNIESVDSNCSEMSINVSTNAEASEPNIESVDSNCSEMSINVSTNAEASEPDTEESSFPVDDKMNRIKEIFGSFPTLATVENSEISADIQKMKDVGLDEIQSGKSSVSIEKLQDSGVFVFSDNETELLQV